MNIAGQHGRHQQAASSSADRRTRNHSSDTVTTQEICRDYIWGICSMGSQCIHRHALEYGAMKEVLKFCHDHQNKTGCTRPDCTYLHTSREEESLFLTTGQIPCILMERYARMEYLSDSAVNENMPPQGMYDYIVQPPPPPPPPQTPVPTGVLYSPHQTLQQPQMQPPMVVGPIQRPMQCPMQGPTPMQACLQDPMQCCMQHPQAPIPIQTPMPLPMQGPAPFPPLPPMPAPRPPPPPPPPPVSSQSSIQMTGPVYSGSAAPAQYNSSPSQPLPATFDPSKPPPALLFQSSGRKRSLDECEAGPSKLGKTDVTNESSCENCVQRLISLKGATSQAEKIQQELDIARKEMAAQKEEYERKKILLRSLLCMNPEVLRRMEHNIGEMSSSSSTSDILHSLVDLLVEREPAPAPSEERPQLSSIQQSTNSVVTELTMTSTFLVRVRNENTSNRYFSESSPSTSRGAVPSAVYVTVPRYSAPGAGPARQYHPGGMQPAPQVYMSSGMPPGTMPNGGMPPGAMPNGGMPPGAMRNGGMPPGAMPNGGMPPGAMRNGGMPPGAMPNGGMRPDAMCNGGMPPGAMPNAAMPSGPTGNMPSEYMPTPVRYNTAPAAPAPRQFSYNGPPYPGSMPQQAPRPALPPNPNYFHAGRYPSQTYYPPYQ